MLNNYIIENILKSENENIEKGYIVSLICSGEYNENLCSYILKVAKSICLNEKGIIILGDVYHMLTPDFCLKNAFDYFEFLKNDHEHEEQEYLSR